MWKTSPTIQALIKMVTSGKFKFPTTDCDEIEREKMSIGENDIRDKVRLLISLCVRLYFPFS